MAVIVVVVVVVVVVVIGLLIELLKAEVESDYFPHAPKLAQREQKLKMKPMAYAFRRRCVNPFRTTVSFWGQSTQTLSSMPPRRGCGCKGVKTGWEFAGCHRLWGQIGVYRLRSGQRGRRPSNPARLVASVSRLNLLQQLSNLYLQGG